jgi:hypothetical protein
MASKEVALFCLDHKCQIGRGEKIVIIKLWGKEKEKAPRRKMTWDQLLIRFHFIPSIRVLTKCLLRFHCPFFNLSRPFLAIARRRRRRKNAKEPFSYGRNKSVQLGFRSSSHKIGVRIA